MAHLVLAEELKPKNAKRMRVQHANNIASKMPRSFNIHTPAESKIMAYVQASSSLLAVPFCEMD